LPCHPAALAAATAALAAAAAAAALPGKLTIRGNQVLEDGKPIRMHGINYFGKEQLDSFC
jgi:hypothetical protein